MCKRNSNPDILFAVIKTKTYYCKKGYFYAQPERAVTKPILCLSLLVANAMYMGGQEMSKVLERDNITIKNNLEKVRAGLYIFIQSAYYHIIK